MNSPWRNHVAQGGIPQQNIVSKHSQGTHADSDN